MRIINEALLSEFRTRGKCELCGRKVYPIDPHHVEATGMDAGKQLDTRWNVIAADRLCHTYAQEANKGDPKYGYHTIMQIISAREGVSVESIEAVRYLFLRLPKRPSVSQFDMALLADKGLSTQAFILAVKTWAEIPAECKGDSA